MHVFRNNTIERFFPKDYSFSGYDDISSIPTEYDSYLWFYQAPIRYGQQMAADEIGGYVQKFKYVLSCIDPSKTIIVMTMDTLYCVSLTDDDHRLAQAVELYNENLYELAKIHVNMKVIDIKDFTRLYRTEELIDWKYYFISQMGLNPRLSKDFQSWWQKKLDSIALKRKKCIVLDLDNTLWGGVLGEDGIEGIKIGGDYPGKAFLYFQNALLELSKSGVILTVCSKNNENDVLDAWDKNPFMVLKKENFAAYRINWQDKASNIRELAEELNIGIDSFVFIDDNPTERELIRQMLPMVSTPEFPVHPYELPVFFKNLINDYFKVYSITDEDKKKTEQYKANAARKQAEHSFTNFSDYLQSLDIHIIVETATEFNLPRIAQMTQKTNQFNLTTHRYTDNDLKRFLVEGWKIWCIAVSDRFGDNGITGCIMITPNRVIDTMLLSCRILGKGIETAFVKKILLLLKECGITTLKADYIPTAKNSQVADFYEHCVFMCVSRDKDGAKHYVINLATVDFTIENYYNITNK